MTPESIDHLVDSLTLAEQVTLLAGANVWETAAIDRVGIPALRFTDGPAGARGTRFDGEPSINVPCSTALAATWDPTLIERVGEVLGRESRAKGARVLLAPTVNLHRTPVGGRNFECMSEDPYLSAQSAVAYVEGVQSEGVACCIKHFVGNDTEFERNSIDSRIDDRTLRELYLVPFEAAVTRGRVMAVMTAYNRLNGPFAADSRRLLAEVLRGEWGFDGLVMSDWFGLHSTVEGIEAGCDVEMPGPTIHRGGKLIDAVERKDVDPAVIRASAKRVVELIARTGGFEDGGPGPETTRDAPEDVALIRSAAAAGMVLLRNAPDSVGEKVLPLAPGGIGRVAVVGPNSAVGQIMGGGSAHVTPTSISHPLEALRAHFGARGTEVSWARGAVIHKQLPAFEPALISPVNIDYFTDPDHLDDPARSPVRSVASAAPNFMWTENPAVPETAHHFGARASFEFTPDTAGEWQLSLSCVGDGRLFVDGELLIDNVDEPIGGAYFGLGKQERQVGVDLAADRTYRVTAELRRAFSDVALTGLRLGAFAPLGEDPVGEAVAVAADADLTILVVGTNDDWESEGWDRETIALPGGQDELIARVAEVSRRCVVVVNAGSPVAMPWLEQVDAVLMAWFPGQEMGNALVDVLTGAVEPQGRLPVTFPKQLADTPAFEHHPGRGGVAHYRERRLMGYRWYDTIGREPLFEFGFGLGYVPVAIMSAASRGAYEIDVTLENEGDRDGVEMVQVYAHRIERVGLPEDEPAQRLVGFTKVTVPPGGCRVEFALDPNAYRRWDPVSGGWTIDHTPHELRIGRSSRDVAARLVVNP